MGGRLQPRRGAALVRALRPGGGDRLARGRRDEPGRGAELAHRRRRRGRGGGLARRGHRLRRGGGVARVRVLARGGEEAQGRGQDAERERSASACSSCNRPPADRAARRGAGPAGYRLGGPGGSVAGRGGSGSCRRSAARSRTSCTATSRGSGSTTRRSPGPSAGIDAADAHAWKEFGIAPGRGRAPREGGRRRPPATMRAWWEAGIPFDEVAAWLGAGLTPEEAAEQRAKGITAERAAVMRALRDPDDAERSRSTVALFCARRGAIGLSGGERRPGQPCADRGARRSDALDERRGDRGGGGARPAHDRDRHHRRLRDDRRRPLRLPRAREAAVPAGRARRGDPVRVEPLLADPRRAVAGHGARHARGAGALGALAAAQGGARRRLGHPRVLHARRPAARRDALRDALPAPLRAARVQRRRAGAARGARADARPRALARALGRASCSTRSRRSTSPSASASISPTSSSTSCARRCR